MATLSTAEAGRHAPPALGERLRRGWHRNAAGYLFLLPWLIGFLGLTLGPTLASLWLSFTDYRPADAAALVGAEELRRMRSPWTSGWGTR